MNIETQAAYQRLDDDRRVFCRVRAELELLLYSGRDNQDVIIECINCIDDALSERVAA